MSKSAIISLSGGMDSTVLAHELKRQGYVLRALSLDYGQKHAVRELACAGWQAQRLDIEHQIINLKQLGDLFGASALTNSAEDIPSGHYTAESMKATIVPNRNMILLSVAGAWAIATRSEFVAYAAHAGDHTIYPDCRAEFAEAIDHALQLSDWHKVKLLRPFVHLDKTDICRKGSELGVDFTRTWSCYRGAEQHCGSCGTCVERKEAFSLAGIEDPTDYRQ